MTGYSQTFPPHRAANTKVVILIVRVPVVQVDLPIVRIPVDTGNVHESNLYDY
jgi:hypothetical protein